MIVVEGPDGAGKSTLISELVELTDFQVAPRVVSKETKALVDMKAWVEENLDIGPHDVIYDRYRLISEFIYGPTLRVEQQPGFIDLDWVYNCLARFYENDPIIVYCLPPLHVVRTNVQGDSDNLAVSDFIEPLYTAYLERASMDMLLRPTRTIIHDYTEAYPGETGGLVLGLLADRRAAAERKTR